MKQQNTTNIQTTSIILINKNANKLIIKIILTRKVRKNMSVSREAVLCCVVLRVLQGDDPCDTTCQYSYQLSSHLHCSAYDGSKPLTHILAHGHVSPIVHVTKDHLQSLKINHSATHLLLMNRESDAGAYM